MSRGAMVSICDACSAAQLTSRFCNAVRASIEDITLRMIRPFDKLWTGFAQDEFLVDF